MNVDKNIFRLKHILASIDKIKFITKNLSYEDFANDWIPQDVVIRNLEIIGEASNHVSDELKQEYPEIEWNLIRGLRNILAHVYFDIDTQQIWNTIHEDLPFLEEKIKLILEKIDKS